MCSDDGQHRVRSLTAVSCHWAHEVTFEMRPLRAPMRVVFLMMCEVSFTLKSAPRPFQSIMLGVHTKGVRRWSSHGDTHRCSRSAAGHRPCSLWARAEWRCVPGAWQPSLELSGGGGCHNCSLHTPSGTERWTASPPSNETTEWPSLPGRHFHSLCVDCDWLRRAVLANHTGSTGDSTIKYGRCEPSERRSAFRDARMALEI